MAVNRVRDNSQARLPQGWRRTGYTNPYLAARGLRGLGDATTALQDLGFTLDQAATIIAASASGALSSAGYNQIISGNITPDALQDFLDTDPGAQAASSTPATTATTSAGVPTGSQVTYQAQIPFAIISTSNWSQAQQAIQSQAPSYGLRVLSMTGGPGTLQTSGSYGVTVTLQVSGPGFAQPLDVASIIDHIIYTVMGQMPLGSSAQVTGLPSSSTAQTAAATSVWGSLGQTLSNNLGTILIVGVLIVLGPSIIKKL